MNDSLPNSSAEQTDPSVLGETVGQTDRPGDDFPPDEPLGVEDPSRRSDGSIAPDDVTTREARERPDEAATSDDADRELGDPS